MLSARSADNRSVSFAGVGNDTASLRGGKPGRKLLRTTTGLPLSDGQAARLAYHLGSAASATSGALPIEGNSSVFWQSEIARPSRRTVTFGPSVLFYGLSNFLDLRGGRAYCTIPPRKADVRLRAPDPNTASAQSVAPSFSKIFRNSGNRPPAPRDLCCLNLEKLRSQFGPGHLLGSESKMDAPRTRALSA